MSRDARARLVYDVSRLHARGTSIRGIARALAISRPTVRRILDQLEERRATGDDLVPKKPARAPRPSKLDPYRDVITELIQRYPDIKATRLYEELQVRGFDGKYTIVRTHLAALRPRRTPRAYNVVETAPGKQAQNDWSPYKLENKTPVYGFSSILSFSRFQYLRFCDNMRQETVFRQMRRAFVHHGGLADEYVFDSMPGIVDRWEMGVPILNLRAVDFAAYYGIALHIAPRADGPYKGKVERPFRFVDESLFNGRTFHTLAQLNETGEHWLENRCNSRKHGRTGRRPVDALADEPLRPLPTHPYDDRELAHRVVDSYAYVRFDGNFYRAGATYVGTWVYLRASEHEVTIIGDSVEILARHERGPRNSRLYIPPPQKLTRPRRRPVGELLACFETWGQSAHQFARCIQQRKRYAAVELAHLLELRTSYSAEDILRAIQHASRYGAYDAGSVERILQATAKPRTLEDLIAENARHRIRQSMASSPVTQRGLAAYARLLSGSDHDADAHEAAHGDNDKENRKESQDQNESSDKPRHPGGRHARRPGRATRTAPQPSSPPPFHSGDTAVAKPKNEP